MENTALTYFYKAASLSQVQLQNYEEAWALLCNEDSTKEVTRDEILRTKTCNSNALYVLSLFSGDVFEHLRAIRAKIVSSHCLLHSHRANKRLPKAKMCPLYSTSMTNLVVCCTNVEKNLRQDIYDKVEMMNGKTSKVFTNDVTHLITTEVGSVKYHAAGDMKTSIMLPSWVVDVWERSVEHDVDAADVVILKKHRCPIFNKYIICASGFTADVKEQLKKLIESEGGVYRGDLVCGKTTHLVINEAKGDKYSHAKIWKISIVNSKWVFDSIEANYCLPEKEYQLEATASTSTPTRSVLNASKAKPSKLDIDISMIANATTRNTINETEDHRLGTTYNPDVTMPVTTSVSLSKYTDFLKELNTIGKIKSVLFDGFGVYSEGFDAAVTEKLKKLFNSGGAIRFEDFQADVTHVIVQQVDEKKCKNYVDLNPEVNILSIDWVIDSCRQNEIADYKNYCVFKNALNSVKTPKKRVREDTSGKAIANQSINISMKSYENDLNNYLSQYLSKEGEQQAMPQAMSRKTNVEALVDKRSVLQEADLNQLSSLGTTTSVQQQHQSMANDNSSLQLIQAEKAVAQKLLFSNKTFSILGFEIDEVNELRTWIESIGGVLNEFDDEGEEEDDFEMFLNKQADYVLFPMTITEPMNIASAATVYWLRQCINQNLILPLNEHTLYQPIPRFNKDRALTGCVVTISGYQSYEKETISNLCQIIGAVTQTSFSSKLAKNIYPNTHLLCKTAEGPKYQAAKSWNIPAVGVEWLIDSVVSGVKADESKYLIGGSSCKMEEFILNLDRIRRNLSDSQQNQTSTMVAQEAHDETDNLPLANLNNSAVATTAGSVTMDFESPQTTDKANDLSLLDSSASKKPRLESFCTPSTTIVRDEAEAYKTPNPEVVTVFKTPQPIAQARRATNGKTPVLATPPCNPRLQVLKEGGPVSSYNTPTSQNTTINDPNWQTPLWLKSPSDPMVQNFPGHLNIDVDKMMELLRTPNPNGGPPLTPIAQKIVEAARQVTKNNEIPNFFDCSNDSPKLVYGRERRKKENDAAACGINGNDDQDDDDIPPTPLEAKELKEILKGVKIYVSKKLSKNTTELSSIVESLGGDFIWIYNQSCTHVVYSGKPNDNNKELRSAKEQNKFIISPFWLYACQEQKQRVDEALFPYTYNPSKCAVVTTRTPKVSLAGASEKHLLSTPVSGKHQQELKASQQLPPRSQAKKTTAQNIIKNYCSDEDDDENNDDEDLAATNQANFRLIKKKQHTNVAPTAAAAFDVDNDSEMNLLDSEFMRNCDKQYNNMNPPLPSTDIPDSIDIKNELLNQLQDTLKNIQGAPGLGNVTASTTTTPNLNTSQTSMLNEYQIMNELNKSGRSKWGKSLSGDLDDQQQKNNNNNEDDDLLCVRIVDDNNSRDSLCENKNEDEDVDRINLKQLNINRKQQQQKYGFKSSDMKKRRQYGDDDDDDVFNTDANANHHHHVAPSQIQVTLWKEEPAKQHQQQAIRRKNENISDRITNYYKN